MIAHVSINSTTERNHDRMIGCWWGAPTLPPHDRESVRPISVLELTKCTYLYADVGVLEYNDVGDNVVCRVNQDSDAVRCVASRSVRVFLAYRAVCDASRFVTQSINLIGNASTHVRRGRAHS